MLQRKKASLERGTDVFGRGHSLEPERSPAAPYLLGACIKTWPPTFAHTLDKSITGEEKARRGCVGLLEHGLGHPNAFFLRLHRGAPVPYHDGLL